MSVIKKFFQKKKLDMKFKKAGEGHVLSASEPSPTRAGTSSSSSVSHRAAPQVQTDATRRAAEAASNRVNRSISVDNDHMLYLKTRVKREMEAEKKAQASSEKKFNSAPEEVILESSPIVSQILFKCPDVGPAVLPKEEMEGYIEEFLLKQLPEEPLMASALMIQTLNKNKDQVRACVETLQKYLDNIISHPCEEKYCKVRLNNKVFLDKISNLKGTDEFLQSVGFQRRSLPFENGEADFYVLNSDIASDTDKIVSIKEILLVAEPIKPVLDRAIKVFHPSRTPMKFSIPDDFYNIKPEELKREQQRKAEAAEKLGILRTKAMRERDEQKELRKYKYTLIRIRLPNNVMFQGIFKAHEPVSAVYEFVREIIADNWMPFDLLSSTGHRLNEEGSETLAEAAFVPAALLNFAWDETVLKEVAAEQGIQHNKDILRPEITSLIQEL